MDLWVISIKQKAARMNMASSIACNLDARRYSGTSLPFSRDRTIFFFFFFYEWEHRTETLCLSSVSLEKRDRNVITSNEKKKN